MNTASILWLALTILFVIAEAATVGMVSLWFAGGALVAMVAALLNWPVWLQAALFLAVSGLLLLALRPIVQKHFTPKCNI